MSTRDSNVSRTAGGAEPDVRTVSTAAATSWCDSPRMCRTTIALCAEHWRTRSHGFRSSFRDQAAERTDHPREVVEAALAQVVGNRTEAAYLAGNPSSTLNDLRKTALEGTGGR